MSKLRDWAVGNLAIAKNADDDTISTAVRQALESGKLSGQKLAELTKADTGDKDKPNSRQVFSGVRVKAPSEAYSHTKSVGKHVRTGQPVSDERGREVMLPSQLETAKAGALFKMLAGRSGMQVSMTEHDRQLIDECFEKDAWCGSVGGSWETAIDGQRVKALINDTMSGGTEVVPEWFDDAVIQFPLLHSEILPKVDLRDVPRGSSVEGASVGNPTVLWGTPEGTAMSVFDTTALVAEINSTIFPVTCAVEIGRELMADSPANIGRVLLENVGQATLHELDNVVVNGNGTSQPQGIKNASGITDVGNPAGGSGATPQIDDYEALLFTVPKQYRVPSMKCAYIANDTTYRRARGIPVGASDARRLFGMDHGSYTLLEHPFLVESNIGNAVHLFGALAKYRLYRRQGQEIRWEQGGRELATKNLALLIMRGRFGGRVVDANAFSVQTHGKA